jgi:hypothetical protein
MRVSLASACAMALVVLAAATAGAPRSLARLTSAPTAAADLGTGSIAPPANLAATVAGATVTLTWTPAGSTIVTGYDVLRSTTSGSGYSVVSTITPRSATTTTNSPGNGTFYFALRSTFQSWSSVASNEASAVVGQSSTGLKECANDAADSGGDGNGYETNPANGCAVDGSLATDANTGTSNSTSCTNVGKDRHRFWGYAFGLPGSVSSINGITAEAEAGLNNNGGTSTLCVELSTDGGSTWTTPKQVTMSGAAIASYTFGGPSDLWGRTWTAGSFATSGFRLRVTDASSQPTKVYRLDAIRVSISYTP